MIIQAPTVVVCVVVVVVVATLESQPAMQPASYAEQRAFGRELCGREPALPAFITSASQSKALVMLVFHSNFERMKN